MASPITHILLTDKIYNEQFGDCNKKEFILWTTLPDISNLDKNISRDGTHIKNVVLHTVHSLTNSLDKWIYFHSLVDRIRDEFYVSKWIYTPGWDEDFIIALKLLEDQYLYHKIKNRNKYTEFFEDIPYKKIKYIKKESLDKRYTMIKDEIITSPNNISRRDFQANLWLTEDYSNKINTIIQTIQQDEKILYLIDELYDTFWLLIQK